MQTFVPYADAEMTAQVLDKVRLGCQRKEASQIGHVLAGLSKGWKNHPAVKMWAGHESYLVGVYMRAMLDEFSRRGGDNTLSEANFEKLSRIFTAKQVKPWWFDGPIHESHKASLLRKNFEHYSKYWPDVDMEMPCHWPTGLMKDLKHKHKTRPRT